MSLIVLMSPEGGPEINGTYFVDPKWLSTSLGSETNLAQKDPNQLVEERKPHDAGSIIVGPGPIAFIMQQQLEKIEPNDGTRLPPDFVSILGLTALLSKTCGKGQQTQAVVYESLEEYERTGRPAS